MKLRLQALRSLRWNYRWRGVWVWLKGRHCFSCGGKGRVAGRFVDEPPTTTCSRCHGNPKRGYQRILTEPEQVIAEQERAGAGVAT